MADATEAGFNSFLSPLLRRATANPAHPFADFHHGAAWHSVTLGDLLTHALRFTALLQARSIPSGSTIMLALRHGIEAPASFLGAMLAGMVPSFLPCPSTKQDHSLYWAQHRTVLAFNRPPLVLTPDDLLADMQANAAGAGATVVALSELARHAPAELPAHLPAESSIALLQHSSGTTGMKKGVALSYASIARQLAAYQAALALDPARARIASWLPLYHDMGLISSFLLPLWLGLPIAAIDPFDWVARPELLFDAIERTAATHAWLPNFAFLHLARRVPRTRAWNLASLAALISCSEPCKPAAFDAFLDRFAAQGIRPATLQTCYAMAETVFAVSQSDPAAPVRRLDVDPACLAAFGPVQPPPPAGPALTLLSNGPPIPGCQIAIRRGQTDAGSRVIGEICIRADYMFAGYHRNQPATQAALQDGWYRTGDIGFIDQGEIFVVGRIKDVIIINGKNVFAHDVEQAVSAIEGVKPGRCVAFGRYSDRAGSEQLIVVAEREGDAAADPQLQRAINRAVVEEAGVTCTDIRLVPPGWLIKTTSGKTSRSDNSLKYAAEFGPG